MVLNDLRRTLLITALKFYFPILYKISTINFKAVVLQALIGRSKVTANRKYDRQRKQMKYFRAAVLNNYFLHIKSTILTLSIFPEQIRVTKLFDILLKFKKKRKHKDKSITHLTEGPVQHGFGQGCDLQCVCVRARLNPLRYGSNPGKVRSPSPT